MSGLPTASSRAAFTAPRRSVPAALSMGVALALAASVAAACTQVVYVTAPPAQSVAAVTATPSATATDPATATPTPSSSPTSVPTPNPTPQPTAAPTATPLPALAQGLCRGSALKLEITAWYGDTGTEYAHVTATNKSGASCNMRGFSEAQIVDGHGSVIGDAGGAAASVRNTDPVYTLNPGDGINTIVTWGNWCKAAPTQNVTVAMVEPFGLGRIVAPANGAPVAPTCYQSSQSTQVSSEAWLP